jgi:hypothetical protein
MNDTSIVSDASDEEPGGRNILINLFSCINIVRLSYFMLTNKWGLEL